MKAYALYSKSKKKYLIKTGKDAWWNLTDNPLLAKLFEHEQHASTQLKRLTTLVTKAREYHKEHYGQEKFDGLCSMIDCVVVEVSNPQVEKLDK